MIEFLQCSIYIIIIPAIISILTVFYLLFDDEYEDFRRLYRQSKIFRFVLPIAILSILYIFVSADLIYSLSRNEIKEKLNDKIIKIKVDNEVVLNDNIVKDFKNVKRRDWLSERISGNTQLNVEINDMRFRLIKDMSRDSLFLVYYENYSSTSANPIGMLISNSLKNY